MPEIEEITLDYDEIERETDGAYLFKIGDEKTWLPKSQIRVYEKSRRIYLPQWLAYEKGLS